MKYITILSLAFALPGMIFAHGSKAEQASHAVEKATALFSFTQSKEVQKDFTSVAAVLTGHERFTVSIGVKNQAAPFKYDCTEDESAEPVVWECESIR